jgi:dephospho-CoA kinase
VTEGFRLIGLTGGIGTGKSTVARLLSARGIPVIDADQLARLAVEPGQPALDDIRAAWPSTLTADGRLDRKALGAIVFADPQARHRLESILHPRIAELANQRALALARDGHAAAFYEASLLVETGRYRELDGMVVVDAPEDVRIARVAARDGLTPEQVRARIAAQAPMSEKRRLAAFVVDNSGDLIALERQVTALLAALAVTPPADRG